MARPQTVEKIVIGNKKSISWECEPRRKRIGVCVLCVPERVPHPADLSLLDFCGDILHQIPRLAVEDFTKLYDRIDSHASVVYEAVHSLGVDLIGLAKVYLFQSFALGGKSGVRR